MQLRSHGLTRVVHSPSQRAEKYRHVVGEALGLEADVLAVLAVLLLRGPQTVNELRTRTERYEPGVPDVEAALRVLATRAEPLVDNVGTPHRSAGGAVDAPARRRRSTPMSSRRRATSNASTSAVVDRIAVLEERVARLEAQLEELLRMNLLVGTRKGLWIARLRRTARRGRRASRTSSARSCSTPSDPRDGARCSSR